MASSSGTVHVTKTAQILLTAMISPSPLSSPQVVRGRLYLFNMNEELDRPAYVGAAGVQPGNGVAIPSGLYPARQPVELVVRPDTDLWIVSDDGKNCWVGWLFID